MTYELGIDPGTTFTAAAVRREGTVEIVSLGDHSAAIPSTVLLKDDGSVLIGDAASRRGLTEPKRLATQFKRRVGDSTPLMLGGSPHSAESLIAKVLRWTVDRVTEGQGEAPSAITVTHPANWGAFKVDRLEQAMRLADLSNTATITEPEAAAIFYASTERVEAGSVIGVYDLGGGTFDAAMLRKVNGSWEILGTPEGIEQLGGVDFDEAVFEHVRRSVPGAFDDLDTDDSATLAALARIRRDCVDAKEGLSSDTEVSIPVLLPTVNTEVRLTRFEFEAMIRPNLQETVAAMQRAFRSAGVQPNDVAAVLLVGGSSRIPLVAEMVGSELGRPVAVDAHPKHAVALGAALAAAHRIGVPPTAPVDVVAGTEVDAAGDVGPEVDPGAEAGRRRAPLVIGAIVALLVAGVIGAILLGGGGGEGGDGDGGDDGSTDSPPGSGEPALHPGEPIGVAPFPDGIAFDQDGALWVASTQGSAVTRVDPDSGEQDEVPLPEGSEPLAVTVTEDGSVWVSLRSTAQIVRVDPSTQEITLTVDVAGQAASFGEGDGSLWVVSSDAGVDRVDPSSGEVTATIELDEPRGVVVTDDAAWVSLKGDAIAEIDLESNEVIGTIDVSGQPDGIAVDDDGMLWVAQRAEGTVARIDPDIGEITDVVQVGTKPADIVVSDGYVWVTDNDEGKLVLLDPDDIEVVAEAEVGTAPLDLAVEDQWAWVSLTGENAIVEVSLEFE
jgi:streptogramin lyase/actin-like ATPase involved in cell morphogenesis